MSTKENNLLVDAIYQLHKFSGKGGWTYAEIPEVTPDKHAWFNWVKVRGFIDHYELKHYRLMPMGNGHLFLPVKAAIRKAINKGEGDTVRIILYADDTPLEITQELIDCFELEDPRLVVVFRNETESQQKGFMDWINEAKKEETKAKRIVRIMDYLRGKL